MASSSPTIPVGYKQTEVGVIPEDWHLRSLGELAIMSKASVVPRTQPHCLFTHYSIPAFDDRGEPEIVKGSTIHSSKFIVPNNAVLISKLNPRMPRIWNPKTVNANAICSTEFVVLSPVVVVERDFLELLCKSEYCYKVMKLHATGTTGSHQRISPTEVMKIKVPFTANVVEQRSIVNAISDCSKLEQSIGKMLMKKRDIKQGTMQELLTGKTRLPGFSDEWENATLKDLVDLIPSGIYGVETNTDNLIEMRVATTAHISMSDKWNNKKMNNRFFTNQQVHDYSPKLGDLVVVKSSGSAASIQSGKMAFVDSDTVGKFIFSNFLMLLRPIGCDTKYLFYQLTSSRVKMMIPFLVESSTYPNIRIEDYMDIEVPLPNNNEQEAIAEILSDMDAEIAALEQRLEKTKAIKQGMMQQLLNGRIRLVDPSTPVEASA